MACCSTLKTKAIIRNMTRMSKLGETASDPTPFSNHPLVPVVLPMDVFDVRITQGYRFIIIWFRQTGHGLANGWKFKRTCMVGIHQQLGGKDGLQL